MRCRFNAFFHHVDHYKTDYFLWVTASGIGAARQSKAPARTDYNSDDEADENGEEGWVMKKITPNYSIQRNVESSVLKLCGRRRIVYDRQGMKTSSYTQSLRDKKLNFL